MMNEFIGLGVFGECGGYCLGVGFVVEVVGECVGRLVECGVGGMVVKMGGVVVLIGYVVVECVYEDCVVGFVEECGFFVCLFFGEDVDVYFFLKIFIGGGEGGGVCDDVLFELFVCFVELVLEGVIGKC